MRLFDEHYAKNKSKYIIQSVMATVVVSGVLIFLNSMSDTAIVAALGASAFITFAMPHRTVSNPRYLIGGYLIGTVIGCSCHFFSNHYLLTHIPFLNNHSREIFGSISVGTAIFLMAITETEHPPAAGLALAFVLNGWNILTIEVVFAGIILIAVVKLLLKRFLIDLV